MSFYPLNTLTSYQVRLPQPISLEGDWEVGLSEIQYPHSWYNVGRFRLAVFPEHMTVTAGIVTLYEGFYHTPGLLISELNRITAKSKLLEWSKKVEFLYNPIQQKTLLKVDKGFKLKMDQNLCRILGYECESEAVIFTEGTHRAKYVMDLRQGFDNLYIYTNIIEPRVVGDSMAPLLRIVPSSGKHGEVVRYVFNPTHYVPLLFKSFETVKVDIRDDTGTVVPFESGKVVVTLHLRRKKN